LLPAGYYFVDLNLILEVNMGDNCCGCDFRDDCDKSEKKDEPTEECVCEECGCDPCECEDADDKKGKDKEEK